MTTTLAPDTETIDKAKAIANHLPAGELRIEGVETPIPSMLADLFRSLVALAAAGEGVTIVSESQDMTPNEAAAFLNVSRGYVVKLMDAGTLPFRMVGAHRRIPSMAVAAHRARQDAIARKAMDELIALNQDMRLYEAPGAAPSKSDFRGRGE